MNGLNWGWIALEATAPPIVGLLFAWPFWRKAQPIFGNLAGTAVIFGSAFALILREQIELDRLMQQCVDAGYLCFPHPAAFTRFAIYASISLVEVFGLCSCAPAFDVMRPAGIAPRRSAHRNRSFQYFCFSGVASVSASALATRW